MFLRVIPACIILGANSHFKFFKQPAKLISNPCKRNTMDWALPLNALSVAYNSFMHMQDGNALVEF